MPRADSSSLSRGIRSILVWANVRETDRYDTTRRRSSRTTVTHVPLNECAAICIAILTLDMQMRLAASESEIITGIAESLTERGTISVNLSLRVFLAIIAWPRMIAACLKAAHARECTCNVPECIVSSRNTHTCALPIIESQVNAQRDKWCIGRPIRFHQISSIVNVRLLAARSLVLRSSGRVISHVNDDAAIY